MKFVWTVLTLSLFIHGLSAQVWQVPIGDAPVGYSNLLSANRQAVNSDLVLAESLIDLVSAYTIDSVYKRKTERHQFVGAAMFRVFGIRWQTVRNTREKIVGTVRKTSITGKEHFTEYDVNFDVVPHLMRSREVVYAGYQVREPMFKARKKVKPGQPPYIPPTPDQSMEIMDTYDIHVECTPLRELRGALDSAFYPVEGVRNLSTHPSFSTDHPAIGIYGPLVLDCNNSCWPEIHPYEWIWWRNAPISIGEEATWHIGFFRDASNRFVHWSSSPRTGQIELPMAFNASQDSVVLNFTHGPRTEFDTSDLHQLAIPTEHWDLTELRREFTLELADGHVIRLIVLSDSPLPVDGLQYWFRDWAYDARQGMITGKLCIAAGIADVFTTALQIR